MTSRNSSFRGSLPLAAIFLSPLSCYWSMFSSWCEKLLWVASLYGWCEVLEPVGLNNWIEKVSLLDSTCFPHGMLVVVEVGSRRYTAWLMESRSRWCEGRRLVNLGSPSRYHCLWMCLGSPELAADGSPLGLSPLQPVRPDISFKSL